MVTVLQYATLAACLTAVAVRVPDARQGRNRTVFLILVLTSLCSLLTIPGPYEAIDRALGGWNATNLILRYLVIATVLLVGLRIAKGLGSPRAHAALTGTAGRWVLATTSLATTVLFMLLDTRGSSAGLLAITEGGGQGAVLAQYYAAAGRAYPAFVSLVLLPALVLTVRSRLPRLVRSGAALVSLGALSAAVSMPFSFLPADAAAGRYLVNYTAVLGYVGGLTLIWLAGFIARPRAGERNNGSPLNKDTL